MPSDKYPNQVSLTLMLPNVVGQRLYCQRHGGHSKPPLPPFVEYFRAGDSFLIYLVNSRRGEEEREFLHYGNDGMGYNLPHIHHGRHWTLVIPSSIWPLFWFSFRALFASMGEAGFNPVSLWNDNVYQLSFNKEPGA